MNFLKSTAFHFFVLLMCAINMPAQELYFENANLENLPSTETYQVFQDSQGFIWIATDAGICKYDGTTNTIYTVKDGISENVVLRIYEDRRKRVWFSTLSGYFFYYENGSFHEIAANEALNRISRPFQFRSFIIGEKDTLYLTCYAKDGLMKIAPDNNYKTIIKQYGSFTNSLRYLLDNKADPSQTISGGGLRDLVKSDSSYIFYLNGASINLSFKGIQGFYHSNVVNNIIKGKDGTVYIPCSNQLTVLKNNGKNIHYYFFPDDLIKIMEDTDGDLWIGTSKNGGYLYRQGDLNKKPVRFLKSLSLTSILVDKEKSVWVSTMEKGVFQCMNKHVLMIPEQVTDFKIRNHQLSASLFSKPEILTFRDDSVYATKHISGIPENATLVSFLETDKAAYHAFHSGLYYSANNKHTFLRSLKGGYIAARYLIPLENDTVLAVTVPYLVKAIGKKVFFMLRLPFTGNFATRLPDKKIVFGSRNNEGIFEFKNNQFIPYLSQFKELKTRINWISSDSGGNLWIATNEKGIYCYDHNGKLHEFSEKNGLISSKVNSCTIDKEGNVWCGTFQGISKLITTDGLDHVRILNFDKNHGLVDMELKNILAFDKYIWCAGKTALFYFKPDQVKKNTYAPPLYFKSLFVKNQPFSLKDSLILNYDQNDFRVQCEIISFKKSHAKTFMYKLNGYDKDWNTSNTGDIRYTNIGYGNYTLSVYGLNNDGHKSTLPIRLSFFIKKPFWYNWYFILLEILLFIAIVYVIFHYWKIRIEQKERAKAAINQQMAEFKMTALRAQMNPHFIFNAIGSIQHYILKNEITQSFNYLSKFSALIRNILNNSRNEYISLSQEINTLQLYVELEQIRFKYPFKFVVDIDEELDTDIEIPTMLIQPYVENSIWHGLMPKESAGVLELILRKQEHTILITIRDNGVGREIGNLEKKYHISKGMSLTAQRIETLERTSNKKFMTTIIDLKDKQGQPAGTEVNLVIPFDE